MSITLIFDSPLADPAFRETPPPLRLIEFDANARPPGRRLSRVLTAARSDPLGRTFALLVIDNAVLGFVGAICSVIMARLWLASDVGTVLSIVGVLNMLGVIAFMGLPTTIVRFLGHEPRQRRLITQAIILTGAFGAVMAAALAVIPGHLGVPLSNLALHPLALGGLLVAYLLASAIVGVGDPAYVARQEVSFLLGKDALASIIRLALILLVSHSSSQSLFLAVFGYTVAAGAIDLCVLSRRLHDSNDDPGGRRGLLQPIQQRFSFAFWVQIAVIVASVQTYLLPELTGALTDHTDSAYVAMALQVSAVLTLIPTQTGQSLLAELSKRPEDLVPSVVRAMRGAYSATLPVALVAGVFAPDILLIFGHQYSAHGATFLSWAAAGSVFFVFNYVSDIALLARHKVKAYAFVNVAGTAIFLALITGALELRFSLLGPAWLVGQASYATISAIALARFADADRRRELRTAVVADLCRTFG